MANVFIDEVEYVTSLNNLEIYLSQLNSFIEVYELKIDEILKYGINDQNITDKLNKLKSDMSSKKKDLSDIGEKFGKDIREYLDKVNELDKYKFPENIKDPVLSILAAILD